MARTDLDRGVGADGESHLPVSGTLEQKPRHVILRKNWVAPIDETVVEKFEVGVAIKHLTGEVTLEQSVGMAAVRHRYRSGIVIFRKQDIPP